MLDGPTRLSQELGSRCERLGHGYGHKSVALLLLQNIPLY